MSSWGLPTLITGKRTNVGCELVVGRNQSTLTSIISDVKRDNLNPISTNHASIAFEMTDVLPYESR